MKRIKKDKQILVKRIFKSMDKYDYIEIDKKTALEIIKNTKSKDSDFRLEKAEWYISISYFIKDFFKSNRFKSITHDIIIIILTLLGKYIYDKWINP